MDDNGDFVHFTTRNGIHLYVAETARFKTTLIDLYVRSDLDGNATRMALIPPLLKRGTSRFPTLAAIERKMEEMYGAHFSTDVEKAGENHVLNMQLSLPNGKFISGTPNLLEEGIRFLSEGLLHPVQEDGGFRSDYLKQEKDNLKNFIESLINDKISYASEMLIRTMFEGENYALYEYGKVEDLPPIGPEDLHSYYREVLKTCPISVYVCGEVDAEEVRDRLEAALDFERDTEREFAPADSQRVPGEERVIREEQDVQQGKLCMGYRAHTTLADPDYFALVWANGILGGFTHSKLFKNVREKHSLAYYATSSFDKLKGALFITSGIEGKNYDKAVALIKDQVRALQAGQISDEEMNNTRAGLVNRLKAMEDVPAQKIQFLMQQHLGGRTDTLAEMLDRFTAVTRDEIVQVAQKLKLDTIYFLAPQSSQQQEGENPT